MALANVSSLSARRRRRRRPPPRRGAARAEGRGHAVPAAGPPPSRRVVEAVAAPGFERAPPLVSSGDGGLSPWLLAGVAALAASAVKLVGSGDEALVERLGVYNRRLVPGLHVIIPLVERVSYHATLRERVLDVPPQACITNDNAPISADAVVYFKVEDTYKARYAVEELVPALQNLVLTQIRTEVGRLSLDETFSSRAALNERLLSGLEEAVAKWGVAVIRVEVRDILPAASIKDALEKQMTAERTKRAAILESEGTREAAVNNARGESEAVVLEARAEAESTVLRAEADKQRRLLEADALSEAVASLAERLGVPAGRAADIYLGREQIEASRTIGAAPSSKVLFVDPASAAGVVAAAAGAADAK